MKLQDPVLLNKLDRKDGRLMLFQLVCVCVCWCGHLPALHKSMSPLGHSSKKKVWTRLCVAPHVLYWAIATKDCIWDDETKSSPKVNPHVLITPRWWAAVKVINSSTSLSSGQTSAKIFPKDDFHHFMLFLWEESWVWLWLQIKTTVRDCSNLIQDIWLVCRVGGSGNTSSISFTVCRATVSSAFVFTVGGVFSAGSQT